jgi:hypothetical protein
MINLSVYIIEGKNYLTTYLTTGVTMYYDDSVNNEQFFSFKGR